MRISYHIISYHTISYIIYIYHIYIHIYHIYIYISTYTTILYLYHPISPHSHPTLAPVWAPSPWSLVLRWRCCTSPGTWYGLFGKKLRYRITHNNPIDFFCGEKEHKVILYRILWKTLNATYLISGLALSKNRWCPSLVPRFRDSDSDSHSPCLDGKFGLDHARPHFRTNLNVG